MVNLLMPINCGANFVASQPLNKILMIFTRGCLCLHYIVAMDFYTSLYEIFDFLSFHTTFSLYDANPGKKSQMARMHCL